MFTEANGDRPNPPYSNTIVLLSTGFSFSSYVDTEGFNRKIAIGVANINNGNIFPSLREFASSGDDYSEPKNACEMRDFLKNRLLCEEMQATSNSTCPLGSTSGTTESPGITAPATTPSPGHQE